MKKAAPPASVRLSLFLMSAVVSCGAADWPMFHGNQGLTGVAEGQLPAKPTLVWRVKTGGPVKSSAAIAAGRVFVGSDDGNVYALALADGKQVWQHKTEGPVESSPLVLEERVFVGSSDGSLYALDAASGKLLWKYATGDRILGGPNWSADIPVRPATEEEAAVTGRHGSSRTLPGGTPEQADRNVRAPGQAGVTVTVGAPGQADQNSDTSRAGVRAPIRASAIIVGSYDYKLHCVEAATGRSNWVFETSNYINGSPAVSGGQAVFGGCDGFLRIINLAEGKQEQEIEAGAYIPGSAALAGGRAFVGHYEGEFFCADLKEGKKLWSYRKTEAACFGAPAVCGDKVIFGARDRRIHCLKAADGTELWSFLTRGKVDSSPAVCGGKVVAGSDDGRLYVLSLETGKELWSYQVGRAISSSPALFDGRIVIGCEDGGVYCFGAGPERR